MENSMNYESKKSDLKPMNSFQMDCTEMVGNRVQRP